MAEPSSAAFVPGTLPDLNANIVNQKSFLVSGTHDSVTTTITTSATISGITAPQYLVNNRTGELIYAEGISGATFTSCTRGADGSTAAGMETGDVLYPSIVANLYNQLVREIKAMAAYVDNADPVALHHMIQEQVQRFLKPDGQIDHDALRNYLASEHYPAIDEDDMASDLDTSVPTQQSVKAYIASQLSAYEPDVTWGDGLQESAGTASVDLVASGGLKITSGELETDDANIDHNALANTHNLTTDIDHDQLTNFVANEHIDWTSDQGATNIHTGNIPDLSSTYAVAAKGVTNGDSHDHSGGDGAQIDHGGLGGLADDDHTQYHNDTRGDARYYTETELDAGQLDNRYFTETEHLNTSAGAGDAGKPIKLDAGGKVDATMINSADVDHDQTTNFTAAEHFTMLDEDTMASNSDTHAATQQSIKAYVDNSISGAVSTYDTVLYTQIFS